MANLVLEDVNLRACQFLGAHRLEGLRIEGDSPFAWAPTSWRWTARRTLAEEHRWRVVSIAARIQEASRIAEKTRFGPRRWWAGLHGNALERKQRGWYPNECKAPGWLEDRREVPSRIGGLYRTLRMGLEDSKNEPGAADFYYGEMEMRRHALRQSDRATKDRGERFVLWLYWLVSGYGLRASRALAWLALTVLVGAVVLALFGSRPDRSFGRALLFAMESSISLLRAPEVKLTAGGEVVQIVLRLLGPLFLGLAIFSLRGRVKR